MSETVHYKGKLRKVEREENETLENQCKRLLENIDLESYYDSYSEMLLDKIYKSYVIHEGVLYSIEGMKSVDCNEDIFISNTTKEGYEFEVKYYNGCCSFSEAMEYALKSK